MSIRAKLSKSITWLWDDNPSDQDDEYRVCRVVLGLAVGKNTIPFIWNVLFDLFAAPTKHATLPPPKTATTNSLQSKSLTPESAKSNSLSRTKDTPYKDSSGNKIGQEETHRAVDNALRGELNHRLYPDTKDFIETYFPSQEIAFQSSHALRNRSDGRWTHWPDGAGQDDVIAWFFKTTDALLGPARTKQYYSSRNKVIAGSTAFRKVDIFLSQKGEGRRNNNDNEVNWADITVVGELKQGRGQNARSELLIQLAGYIREVFGCQHNRRFVHAFTLTKEYLRCWIFHRGGGFGSQLININDDPQIFVDVVVGYGKMTPAELGFDTTLTFDGFRMNGCSDTFNIVKVIFWRKSLASRGTTCFDLRRIGEQQSLYVLKESWRGFGHHSEVELLRKAQLAGVKGLTEYLAYEDVQCDGVLDDIRGSIMKGLPTGPTPMQLVFANSTTIESPGCSTFIAAVAEKPSFPAPVSRNRRLFGCATCPLPPPGPEPDRTSLTDSLSPPLISNETSGPASRTRSRAPLTPSSATPVAAPPSITKKRKSSSALSFGSRKLAKPNDPTPEFNRVHSRILMRKGREIYNFDTPQELLLGLHDAIEGHRSLYQAGILHRDISIFNIMLALGTRSDSKRGFLIDLDMAIEIANLEPSTAPHRTGTREFMAIEVLHGHQITHTYRHDLESFFYVFVWICVYGHWWHNNIETPIRAWARGGMRQSALYKTENMRRGAPDGWQTVEMHFAEWAEELKVVADKWRKVLFSFEGEDGTVQLATPDDPNELYEPVLALLKDGASRLDELELREKVLEVLEVPEVVD